MCEKKCDNCKLVRFFNHYQSRSFCVTEPESKKIEAKIARSTGQSTTLKKPTDTCDRPDSFRARDPQGRIIFGMGGTLCQPKEKG